MNLEETKEYTRWLGKLAVIGIIIVVTINLLPIGRDNTDGSWPSRSGMKLHIDDLTGCEYLANPQGGIYPRISNDGKTQVGCK